MSVTGSQRVRGLHLRRGLHNHPKRNAGRPAPTPDPDSAFPDSNMPRSSTTEPASPTAAGRTALLIIDMITCWDFPDADRLVGGALEIVPAICALKTRCRALGVPVIYTNDNHGQWRSDFATLVRKSRDCGSAGARITEALAPEADDYFVLKPKHSGFFSTPLELLLRDLGVARVLLTGIASDQCVLVTAAEARMRDLDVVVPRDCVASQSSARNAAVLAHYDEVLKVATTPGPEIELVAQRQPENQEP